MKEHNKTKAHQKNKTNELICDKSSNIFLYKYITWFKFCNFKKIKYTFVEQYLNKMSKTNILLCWKKIKYLKIN